MIQGQENFLRLSSASGSQRFLLLPGPMWDSDFPDTSLGLVYPAYPVIPSKPLLSPSAIRNGICELQYLDLPGVLLIGGGAEAAGNHEDRATLIAPVVPCTFFRHAVH